MQVGKSSFNRNLIIILIALYLLTITSYVMTNFAAEPGFQQPGMLLLNSLILSIPLVLLYGSIYVLVSAWREHARSGQVSPKLAQLIHWAPRIAAILIIFFIALFSLDVFEMDAPPLQLLGGFLVHNIPAIVLIVLLVIAWKRPVVGFVAFLAAGVLFTIFFVRSIDSLSNLLFFVFPILLIAGLFYVDWKWLSPQPPAAQADPTMQP